MPKVMKETLERELKLGVARNFRLPKLPGDRLEPRPFTSIYYDTADYRLAKAGITLRRRVEARKGVWQLKLPTGSARREIEVAGGSSAPPDTLLTLLVAHLRGHSVAPIAKLRTRRVGVRVTDVEGPLADVVVDSVVVLDGERVARRFSELEVELTGGDAVALRRLEKTLRAAGANDGDARPKVFKALGLQLPMPPDPMPASAPASDHLKRMLGVQIQALLAHDPGTRLGTDPEDLHQMRVATRRLRAFLRAARSMLLPEWVEGLRAELTWLGSVLGPVRDFDVLVERLQAECAALTLPERRAFAKLLRLLEPEGAKARTEMLDALQSPRYLQLLDQIEAAAHTPRVVVPSASLRNIAASEFKKLRRSMRALGANPSDEGLHQVRIKSKRARYAAELAEVTIGKQASRFISQSKTFQDLLGQHQDAIVIEGRLRKLLSRTHSTLTACTVGRLVERQCASCQAVRASLMEEWKKLAKRGQKAWAGPSGSE